MENHSNIELQLKYIRDDIKEIKESLKDNYVKKEEFQPVRNIVYGLVALILTGVIGALIALIIK